MTENPVKKKEGWRETGKALATALILALFLRAFVIEAFMIPSGSMIPTLLEGDHIFVNKFVYGLRVPFTKKWFVHFRKPERGEVIVFFFPLDESKNFIKRVIGVAGDTIRFDGDSVFVNGKKISREPLEGLSEDGFQHAIELYDGHRYEVQFDQRYQNLMEEEILVPEGHFFVMGDNRHHSEDSRAWGFVPLENIKGRAMFVWLSLNKNEGGLRLNRFGHWVR